MLQPDTSLTFVVKRHAPELVAPAACTPRELKQLSDMDDQEGLRSLIPIIQFYNMDPKMRNKNPANVIREALAKLLVFYYPFAGRLKEVPGEKMLVDCTGEGVLFIEADADVTLKEFGDRLHPPFPCLKELLCHVPGFDNIVGSPLILIQVTNLLCGGFIFTSRFNHIMCDGLGMAQFLTALGEMAQGALTPSIKPVWQRELLIARDPPSVTFNHHEYDEVVDIKDNILIGEMTEKSFFFGPNEISALRRFVPDNLKSCTTFEMLTACIWRCRTIALQPNPEENMRLMFFANARTKLNPPMPVGYYGNCIVVPCAISTARDLCNKTFGHALQLVMKAKSIVSNEYVRSTVDLMVIKERPYFNIASSTYMTSSLTRAGFNEINYGWGKAIFGGPAAEELIPEVSSYYLHSTNSNGDERGTMVPICLPRRAMEKFVKELNIMLT